MNRKSLIICFWRDVAEQNAANLKAYFTQDAMIKWHNTNELFTVDEYIVANCEYPGTWNGIVERVEEINDMVITVVRVYNSDESISVHATSFFKFKDNKIIDMDEYWGDDGQPPKWRLDKKIGKHII